MRRALVAVFSVIAVAALAAPASAAVRPLSDPVAGSPGIGDGYYPDYGNGGYDVSHYDVRLRYTPNTDMLTGTTTILARATEDLSQFDLDFALTVSSVRVNGWLTPFTRQGPHELVVQPVRPLASGQQMTVVVQYADSPSTVKVNGFTSWTRTADGAIAANEPEIAWWWFPSNDHPLDKATYDISVSVPNDIQAISNGTMQGRPVPETLGYSRWYWRETKPMASYLAFLAIGHYDIHTDVSQDGQPVITAYDQSLGDNMDAAQASVERTSEIVDWESDLFGPYPFDARGGVVTPTRSMGFALEDQTRPTYDGVFFSRGANPYVVVHENAHQWFGDSVSVAAWRNIWLNEGFAAYTEWLWSEDQGEGSAQDLFDYTYATDTATDPGWQIEPGDPGADHLFDGLPIYDRGAMALHEIRLAVGDGAFFDILRQWAAAHQYGNGTIEQFEALAEQVSGQDLHQLIQTWLFTPGRPALPAAQAAKAGIGPHALAKPAQPKSWTKIEDANRLLAGH